MRQHALNYRRLGIAPGGYETMERRSAGAVVDDQMLRRHEYLSRQHAASGDGQGDDLARRERELYLLQLQALD